MQSAILEMVVVELLYTLLQQWAMRSEYTFCKIIPFCSGQAWVLAAQASEIEGGQLHGGNA